MNELIFCNRGKNSYINTHLYCAIQYNYHLGGNHYAVLLFIILAYNRKVFSKEKETSVSLSYDDLQQYLGCNKRTSRNVIKELLKLELIICDNIDNREGRSKYKYKPNVELINKISSDYLEKFPEFKNVD